MKKSTTIIIIIVILLVISLGILYSASRGQTPVNPPGGTTATSTTTGTGATGGTATLPSDFQIYDNTYDGFTMYYPADITTLTEGSIAPGQDWMYGADSNHLGGVDVTVDLATSFEPQTNFDGARFRIGSSATTASIANCLTAPQGNAMTTSQTTINGINFTVFHYGDAGAGNFYDITSYRTLHAGKCFAVEYVVHSANIGNFDPSQHIAQFDESKVTALMEDMVHSFKFQ